jgi:hypothetical protein
LKAAKRAAELDGYALTPQMWHEVERRVEEEDSEEVAEDRRATRSLARAALTPEERARKAIEASWWARRRPAGS